MRVNANECAAVQLQQPVNGSSVDCGCPHWNRLQELRKVRLHHWNCAMQITPHIERVMVRDISHANARQLTRYNENLEHLKTCKARHLTFVQILNQFFDIGDTAEQDAAK